MLVDIISKNGTMLLNILQRPDGTIDDEAVFILEELGKWFDICGEAVYSTRPYTVEAEGTTKVEINGFTENKTRWNASDIRFTRKQNDIFAFLMAAAGGSAAVIKSLRNENIKDIELLGYGKVEWASAFGVVTVKLPETLPTEYVNVLRIST